MPTNANAYNSRLTDEALEKRFRDTFRSQGGSELVDDLYASGVIVPVVDFTAAAEGSALRQDLQTAWDFTTGSGEQLGTGTTNLISNAGFWLVQSQIEVNLAPAGTYRADVRISDGTSIKKIWIAIDTTSNFNEVFISNLQQIVFLRSGDTLQLNSDSPNISLTATYRQIADVSGNLTNPTGFTSS